MQNCPFNSTQKFLLIEIACFSSKGAIRMITKSCCDQFGLACFLSCCLATHLLRAVWFGMLPAALSYYTAVATSLIWHAFCHDFLLHSCCEQFGLACLLPHCIILTSGSAMRQCALDRSTGTRCKPFAHSQDARQT